MLQDAAKADIEMMKPSIPKEGKYEVIFPVAFPDEGTFDWLDGFLQKNPQYVEISDRKLIEWAEMSGVKKTSALASKTHSRDKPDFNFGLPGMDDMSIRRVLNNMLPHVPRNYVIMEVRSNLVKAEREEVLKCFPSRLYKKIGHVVMGQPSDEFKEQRLDIIRQEKQKKA